MFADADALVRYHGATQHDWSCDTGHSQTSHARCATLHVTGGSDMSAPPNAAAWRPFFVVAAIFNISAALPVFFAPELHIDLFFTEGARIDGPVAAIYTQMLWAMVLFFGIGYAIVARDPSRDHGIVQLAIPGKTYVAVVFVWHWLDGTMAAMALAGGIGDLLFAVAFVVFLRRHGRRAPHASSISARSTA